MSPNDIAELKRLSVWFDRLYQSATEDNERIAALESRVRELMDDSPKRPIKQIPFTEPPLKLNTGSWDRNDDQRVGHVLLPNGALKVSIAQGRQTKSRVIRRDFGLQDPAFPVGGGAYLREPKERARRYELKVKVPDDYSGKGELCTLGLKWHTHSAHDPAYLAFIAWSTTTRWRVNHPDGAGRDDYDKATIRPGHTYSLEVEAYWSQGPQGRIRAWTDGKLVVDYLGPNYSREEDKPPYLLVGAYFPSAIEEFSEVFEFSDLRVGDIS